uniref:ULD domain-containing protein n=1 Tax=Elaeophora elaphi TaxID=1147741 RepID=A0A0R3RR00_9BILA
MSMFPVRVVVESVRPQHCLTCARDGHMLVDSYAIVSGATLLSQLVDTVLSALGMPQLAVNSKESPDNCE